MTSGEPFVSVVTPFYNTDRYLAECIESVLGQTYQNFEYVLVDNHSTDRSGEIAAEYAQRDPRIRVVRADRFRNQIPNYNYAIQQLSSDSRYVKFAQADDWLYPSCLSELIGLAEANPAVAVVSSYDLRGNEVYGSGLSPNQRVLSGRETGHLYFLKSLFLFGSPTTVLYRGDVVRARTPFFPEGSLHPDTEAVFEILAEHDFGFVHQVLCFIRTQEDSITGRQRDLADTALDRLIIVKRFGRLYLDPAEYLDCVTGALTWYYDELGRRWLAERMGKPSEQFWAFHRKGLATIGEAIQRTELLRGVGRVLLRGLFNPGSLLPKLRKATVRPDASTRTRQS